MVQLQAMKREMKRGWALRAGQGAFSYALGWMDYAGYSPCRAMAVVVGSSDGGDVHHRIGGSCGMGRVEAVDSALAHGTGGRMNRCTDGRALSSILVDPYHTHCDAHAACSDHHIVLPCGCSDIHVHPPRHMRRGTLGAVTALPMVRHCGRSWRRRWTRG